MNITIPSTYGSVVAGASGNAVEGIQQQQQRLQRNVVEVARGEKSNGYDTASRDRALVEQNEIVQAVRANARSLEVANQMLGRIIDIKV